MDQPAHTYRQLIHPLLHSTAMHKAYQKTNPQQPDMWHREGSRVDGIGSLAKVSRIYCTQTHLPKNDCNSRKWMLPLWTDSILAQFTYSSLENSPNMTGPSTTYKTEIPSLMFRSWEVFQRRGEISTRTKKLSRFSFFFFQSFRIIYTWMIYTNISAVG